MKKGKRTAETRSTGVAGEDAALGYLLDRGMLLMERNWRHRHLEVDLIMLSSDGIHIVEVKTRTAPVLVEPQVSVDGRKRHFLMKAASAYVLGHGITEDVHFDIVTVVLHPCGQTVTYIPDAFTQFDAGYR